MSTTNKKGCCEKCELSPEDLKAGKMPKCLAWDCPCHQTTCGNSIGKDFKKICYCNKFKQQGYCVHRPLTLNENNMPKKVKVSTLKLMETANDMNSRVNQGETMPEFVWIEVAE